MTSLLPNQLPLTFINPQNNQPITIASGDALYNPQTSFIHFFVIRNLLNQRNPISLQLCSQKIAPVERNRSIAGALTTLLGVFIGFDELLECQSEAVDFIFDTGFDFMGRGAANVVSLATAKEDLAYYDMQTKQRVFNFPIYLQ
ncbi:MAG: hypothetical protein HC764_27175 [Pleurocapsa sp. CRU_1_2]|nr:hypothetical protein [Pleurocapsa sp. CRU_1_2]